MGSREVRGGVVASGGVGFLFLLRIEGFQERPITLYRAL